MANAIHSESALTLVVVEKQKRNKSNSGYMARIFQLLFNRQRFKKYFLKKILRSEKKKALYEETLHNQFFNNKWKKLQPSISFIEVDDINSDIVFNRLLEIKPDLIIDKGTSIVKDHILSTAKLALNAHSGLSPYYRGAYCTKWALINWDPYNIGVTIHKLTKVIDGGDILIQARAEIQPNDTAYSIDMQLGVLGTQLFIKIINLIRRGSELSYKVQDFSQGYITNGKQWNEHMENGIRFIETNGLIETMLKKPARKQKLTIIEEL